MHTPEIVASPALNVGLLVLRLVLGISMVMHGSRKLLGWFGGRGLTTTGEHFAKLGFQPGRAFAAIASATEVTSGLLVALGLLGPIGPALMIAPATRYGRATAEH